MKNVVLMDNPKGTKDLKIDAEKFIELYNEGKAELLDVRMPFENDVWSLNFGLKIPAPKLPENLDKLPKDKLIVCACPGKDRSIIAMSYLRSEGFNAGYLDCGLLGLMTRLKGGKAKDLNLGK
jgi:rhodanese-related sulfurtransferase